MFSGPAWIRRLVACGVQAGEVVRDLQRAEAVVTHEARLEGVLLLAFLAPECFNCRHVVAPSIEEPPPRISVTEALRSYFVTSLRSLRPDGLGTFLSDRGRSDGCRGFVGPFPSTPLDAYGYVGAEHSAMPVRCEGAGRAEAFTSSLFARVLAAAHHNERRRRGRLGHGRPDHRPPPGHRRAGGGRRRGPGSRAATTSPSWRAGRWPRSRRTPRGWRATSDAAGRRGVA